MNKFLHTPQLLPCQLGRSQKNSPVDRFFTDYLLQSDMEPCLVPYMRAYIFILGMYTFLSLARLFLFGMTFFVWRDYFLPRATFFCQHDFFHWHQGKKLRRRKKVAPDKKCRSCKTISRAREKKSRQTKNVALAKQ